jgi:hypothetical protein
MGLAALILGFGDAFHLVPRVLDAFSGGNYTAALGIGKLVTSLTMTAFYVLVYRIGCDYFSAEEPAAREKGVWILAIVRAAVCLFPQNGWIRNESGMLWGILRNIPFLLLGILVLLLYFQYRKDSARFARFWLWIALSFLFYIPVAVFAGAMPVLGMLMIPKTVCYLAMVWIFYKAVTADPCRD